MSLNQEAIDAYRRFKSEFFPGVEDTDIPEDLKEAMLAGAVAEAELTHNPIQDYDEDRLEAKPQE